MWPYKEPVFAKIRKGNLLGGGVFSDSLGSFRDGVLGEFSGEEESYGGLDFSGRNGRLLVVLGESGGFVGDSLEDVGHERVHDGHGLGGNTGVGVNLLQDLVDVDGVRFLSLGTSLLLLTGWGSLLYDSFLRSFSGGHFENSRLSLNGEVWQRSALFIATAGKPAGLLASCRARALRLAGFPASRI